MDLTREFLQLLYVIQCPASRSLMLAFPPSNLYWRIFLLAFFRIQGQILSSELDFSTEAKVATVQNLAPCCELLLFVFPLSHFSSLISLLLITSVQGESSNNFQRC